MFCFYLSVIMIYCIYWEFFFESEDVGNWVIYGGGGEGGVVKIDIKMLFLKEVYSI